MKQLVAIIPAKRESEKFNKNLLPFGESNLLVNKIRQLKQVEKINEIIVSSECNEILEFSKKEGVTPLRRPIKYAEKNFPFGMFVEYIVNQVESEHILWGCCTSPFVETELYDKAIKLYYQKLQEGYDSLITVLPQKRFMLDNNGTVNFRRGLHHKNSDELKELFIFTNGIILAPRINMIQWKYNWGHIPYMMQVDKRVGIDISDSYDYNIAKLVLKQGENICL